MKNNLICLACGKKFYKPPSRIQARRGKFCSVQCRANASNGKYVWGGYRKICKTCGKEFKDFPSNKTVNCSKKCSSEYQSKNRSGELSPSWKGGLTPYYKQIRRGLKFREWHKTIFRNDNFTCRKCGQWGGKLQADHIKPIALYPELLLEISNGQTLCISCHRQKTKIDMQLIKSYGVSF